MLLENLADELAGLIARTVLSVSLVKIKHYKAEPGLVGHVTIFTGIAVHAKDRIPDHVVQGLLGEVSHLIRLGANHLLSVHENAVEVGSRLESVKPAVVIQVPEAPGHPIQR